MIKMSKREVASMMKKIEMLVRALNLGRSVIVQMLDDDLTQSKSPALAITTEFYYPDGKPIKLYVRRSAGGKSNFEITDLGATHKWLVSGGYTDGTYATTVLTVDCGETPWTEKIKSLLHQIGEMVSNKSGFSIYSDNDTRN